MNFKNLISQRILIVTAAFLALCASAGCHRSGEEAAENMPAADIHGVWTGSAQQTASPNPTITLKLNTNETGEVWGTITSMDRTFEEAIISGGKLSGNKVAFSATANGTNWRNGHSFSFEAEVKGDTMDGIWQDILDRNRGPFTVLREKEPPAAETKKP